MEEDIDRRDLFVINDGNGRPKCNPFRKCSALHGHANRHNSRYWTTDNFHWKRKEHIQYPEMFNFYGFD